jgi:hypothetical protein
MIASSVKELLTSLVEASPLMPAPLITAQRIKVGDKAVVIPGLTPESRKNLWMPVPAPNSDPGFAGVVEQANFARRKNSD